MNWATSAGVPTENRFLDPLWYQRNYRLKEISIIWTLEKKKKSEEREKKFSWRVAELTGCGMKDFYPAFCLLFLWLIRSCSKLSLSVVKIETWDDVRRFLWSSERVQTSLITSVQVLSRLSDCLLIVRRKRSKLRSINKQVCNLHLSKTQSESLGWFKNKKE